MTDESNTEEAPKPLTDAEFEKHLLDLSVDADSKGLFIFIVSPDRRGQYMRPDVLRNRIYLGEKFPRELEFTVREPRELEEQYMRQVDDSQKLLSEIRTAISQHKDIIGHEKAREAEYYGIENLIEQFSQVPADDEDRVRKLRDVAVSIRSLVTSNIVSQLQTIEVKDSPKSARIRDRKLDVIRRP